MKHTGNALFLILIAVALFAALSYAVTQSGRGGGSVDREQTAIAGAQITQYATSVKYAIDKMQLFNGCADTDISADASFWGHSSYQHTPPVSSECKMYESDGGGIVYQTPNETWLDQNASPNGGLSFQKTWQLYYSDVEGIGQSGSGAGSDLLLVLCCLKQDICTSINDSLGVQNDSGDAPLTIGALYTNRFFSGAASYSEGTNIYSSAPGFSGHASACVKDAFDNTYNYYHVLIAR